MIGSLGRRLRLVLHQPEEVLFGAVQGDPASLPEVEFVAYAVDGRLSGRIRLDTSRLSDMLNDHAEFLLEQVLVEGLPEGGTMVVPELLVRRSELVLVHATGPRGDRARRTRTTAHALELGAGPHRATGNIHVAPGVDPVLSFRRRRPMVPLTDATIEYATPRGPVREFAGTIVVNRDQLDWVKEIERGSRRPDPSGIGPGRPGPGGH